MQTRLLSFFAPLPPLILNQKLEDIQRVHVGEHTPQWRQNKNQSEQESARVDGWRGSGNYRKKGEKELACFLCTWIDTGSSVYGDGSIWRAYTASKLHTRRASC